jgi:hypothetical protein
MPRRKRIDSTTAAVEVMKRAMRPIVPPAHIPLSDEKMPFWESVIAEMARSEWSPHQLEMAALLAQNLFKVVKLEQMLEADGPVLHTERGPIPHPVVAQINSLHGVILRQRASLQIQGRAQRGEARDAGKRRAHTLAIEEANPLVDDLLARPTDLN